ncbi:T9SS type A sorting domain-containing protein [Epilithonimonas zeae]|uniref:T9SS type A sorting domain-containing protein n=1 Tax=Epilithonimonas zeae TaxID=1416779 RepID=UPI00200F3035|nr:T9SS type A sorting domain-containing protein [Epilithonimonas zeae]UQB67463.1 T9SS type A sorting domain-containing protein [Epilithonimonas zeae]
MKKIICLTAVFTGSFVFAQTALNRDWYLQKMTFNGTEYTPQNEESIARLTYDTGWGDVNTQVCMQRSYNITNVTSTQYGISQYSGIAGNCASPITTDFQTKYFSALQKTTNFIHNYVITGTGNGQILTLTTSAGDTLVFGTQKVLGVNDITSKIFAVYPNPAKDIINIAGNGYKVKSAAIYDLSGKMLISESSNTQIKVTPLKKGVYILQVSSEDKTQNIKIIKE